ncbi:hypothetical protein [Denitrovibrio acetiphilus]|nr:hypothetical protein [Denitrovibrio acetiphilus]
MNISEAEPEPSASGYRGIATLPVYGWHHNITVFVCSGFITGR